MNGRYPSTLWDALCVGVLVGIFIATVVYAPLFILVGIGIGLLVIAVAALLYGLIFDVEVSHTRKQEDEKT